MREEERTDAMKKWMDGLDLGLWDGVKTRDRVFGMMRWVGYVTSASPVWAHD